ncbi:MAG: hypothetical protein GF418_14975 [Chitinivibrionales bacterium]|nr:hypothetical protein [Chitinivibrionales bacterium]MBD3396923.1 hypothetical protein [Chitinivibrionales bacterium]
MLLVSNRAGGRGKFDIWRSERKNGAWQAPVNLGLDVNTSSNEYRPVLCGLNEYRNQMLIFSSDRPGGKGGYDIYFRGID